MLRFIFALFIVFSPLKESLQNVLSKNEGVLKITFINVVKKEPMVLRTNTYTNPFNESYSINKFKYYISNISLQSSLNNFDEKESYHLINQDDSSSLNFSFAVPAGTYNSITFLLGVDSMHNVSGAQTDALDPVNDMFWTWNSGYVMAKMEGTSPASPLNNIFEFHIGGYSGINKVLKNIQLQLSSNALIIHQDKTSEILIACDANAWWQKPNDIKISQHQNITSPGILAKKISDNYSKMFAIKEVINN